MGNHDKCLVQGIGLIRRVKNFDVNRTNFNKDIPIAVKKNTWNRVGHQNLAPWLPEPSLPCSTAPRLFDMIRRVGTLISRSCAHPRALISWSWS